MIPLSGRTTIVSGSAPTASRSRRTYGRVVGDRVQATEDLVAASKGAPIALLIAVHVDDARRDVGGATDERGGPPGEAGET